jgi:hypothetical protein
MRSSDALTGERSVGVNSKLGQLPSVAVAAVEDEQQPHLQAKDSPTLIDVIKAVLASHVETLDTGG